MSQLPVNYKQDISVNSGLFSTIYWNKESVFQEKGGNKRVELWEGWNPIIFLNFILVLFGMDCSVFQLGV